MTTNQQAAKPTVVLKKQFAWREVGEHLRVPCVRTPYGYDNELDEVFDTEEAAEKGLIRFLNENYQYHYAPRNLILVPIYEMDYEQFSQRNERD